MTEAYPLSWPALRPRTPKPERSRFDVQPGRAVEELIAEIGRLGGTDLILSTNIPLRKDGLPHARWHGREPEDPGVAVYFERKGKPMCFSCDRWDQVKDNMRAIQKTIEAMRGIERWGTGDMVEQSFSGFAMLTGPVKRLWWQILDVAPDAADFIVTAAYRSKLKDTHPDTRAADKDDSDFEEVQWAFETYKQERNL